MWFEEAPIMIASIACSQPLQENTVLPTTEANNNNVYDLIVVGSGPAGQKAAICAAKMRKKVAVVERKRTIGGVCVHTGTIPSKTFREAILYLSGLRQRTFYGRGYALKDSISMAGPGLPLRLGDGARDRGHQGAAAAQSRDGVRRQRAIPRRAQHGGLQRRRLYPAARRNIS